MSLLRRAWHAAQTRGFLWLIKRVPSFLFGKSIRPFIPQSGFHHKNGVRWRVRKSTDSLTHPHLSDDPAHEEALISAVREEVTSGDSVGVIGGGRGISTVAAARRAGPAGRVTAYEASAERVDWIERTVGLNDVEATIEVNHALVGPDVRVYGEMGPVSKVRPSELPDFDVLEMDCEGAELDILRDLTQQPRVIIVEVHPPGVTEQAVEEVLNDMGYRITRRGWENEDTDTPLPVLTAKRRTYR